VCSIYRNILSSSLQPPASVHLLYSLFIFTVSNNTLLIRFKNLFIQTTTNSLYFVNFWVFILHATFMSCLLFLPSSPQPKLTFTSFTLRPRSISPLLFYTASIKRGYRPKLLIICAASNATFSYPLYSLRSPSS